jgi:hypothetical protein
MNSAAVLKGVKHLEPYLALVAMILVVFLAISGWLAVLFSIMRNTASDEALPILTAPAHARSVPQK